MTLQSFPNSWGTIIMPSAGFPGDYATTSNTTINAAGESLTFIGRCFLTTGPGTSKVISSAGGKIYFKTGTVTLADAGTTLRVGIQDVAATGLEDGTFDVYGDYTSAGAPTANAINSKAMSSGTKTINHGDLIAISIELTTWITPDSIVLERGPATPTSSMPYVTQDTTGTPVRNNQLPICTIEFDDGTMGWLGLNSFAHIAGPSSAFHLDSTPDEHALVFQIPFKVSCSGAILSLSALAVTDDFEIILYSDPLGTPVASRTVVVDADLLGTTSGLFEVIWATPITLEANTNYAIGLRPTTTNSITYERLSFGAGNGNLRKPTMLGTNWSLYTRSGNTGAFGGQDLTVLPQFGIIISQFSDDAGAGGTVIAGTPMLRGMVN